MVDLKRILELIALFIILGILGVLYTFKMMLVAVQRWIEDGEPEL